MELGAELVGRAAAGGFFQHFAEVVIFAARGFEIEDEIFDAETEIVEALLKAADGLAEALVASAGFIRKFFEFLSLAGRERADLSH